MKFLTHSTNTACCVTPPGSQPHITSPGFCCPSSCFPPSPARESPRWCGQARAQNPLLSAGRRRPLTASHLPFSLSPLLTPHTEGHKEQSEQQRTDLKHKPLRAAKDAAAWASCLFSSGKDFPKVLLHNSGNPRILLFSPPRLFAGIGSGIAVLPPPTKTQNRPRRNSRQSVQRFYLTVIKGEADDDSKPVNPGLGFTDNMHQIKLTKISLGAGRGRVRGKDVATRKPHVLGPSSNTTSTWEDPNKRAAELEHACRQGLAAPRGPPIAPSAVSAQPREAGWSAAGVCCGLGARSRVSRQ